jgi:hypothetical protein
MDPDSAHLSDREQRTSYPPAGDPLKRGVPTIIYDSNGYVDVEAYDTAVAERDRLRAENEQLKVEHREFVDGLTEALNAHGVPAMPSWRDAIDWLASCGASDDFLAPSKEDS